jgi:hypothetical protein
MCVQSLQIIIFGGFCMRISLRKHGRVVTKIMVTENFTMCEMFAWFKGFEGLATRIIEEYGIDFIWLLDYLAFRGDKHLGCKN